MILFASVVLFRTSFFPECFCHALSADLSVAFYFSLSFFHSLLSRVGLSWDIPSSFLSPSPSFWIFLHTHPVISFLRLVTLQFFSVDFRADFGPMYQTEQLKDQGFVFNFVFCTCLLILLSLFVSPPRCSDRTPSTVVVISQLMNVT